MKRKVSVTNFSSENNLLISQLNAPVVFSPVHFCTDDDWSIQLKRQQVIFQA